MLPKAVTFAIRVGPVSFPAANILKQEMLSLGGDCALPRDAITGAVRFTCCILIGSASHLEKLRVKLLHQPFGLRTIATQLQQAIAQHENTSPAVFAGGRKLAPKRRPLIMGIINITPDSFSGDGMGRPAPGRILDRALELAREGADIIDIGGESTRPGAKQVPVREELRRVIPAVRCLAKKLRIPVSVDTYKAETARQALDNGAAIINDITGLRDPAMARVCAARRCGVVIMHMKGTPATMSRRTQYTSLIEDIHGFFRRAVDAAVNSGIAAERIILDPGICFAKDVRQNLEILKNLGQFKSLGRPLLVGVSRKSFIGKLLGDSDAGDRLEGTLAACTVAAANGADILRVHDVKETARAMRIARAIINS